MNKYVTKNECKRIRKLRGEGVSVSEIADRLDRHQSTVIVHAYNDCTHMSASNNLVDMTRSTIVTAITRLADEFQEIPSKKTWEQWDERPCSADTVADRLGSWDAALEAAGLPVIAANTPQAVRKAAYQRPELAATTDE